MCDCRLPVDISSALLFWPMDTSCRLFLCVGCLAQVITCRRCDRGQVYCARHCAQAARRRKCQEAGQRYQASQRGRLAHALRQRRYRARKRDQKNKVTHQGSLPPPPDDVLAVNSVAHTESPSKPTTTATPTCTRTLTCHFCRQPRSSLLRRNPLRRRVSRKSGSLHAYGGLSDTVF